MIMDAALMSPPRRLSVPIDNRWGAGEMAVLDFGDPNRPVDLIFSHANGFNAATYRSLLAPLSASLRIWAPDLRGHGRSNLPTFTRPKTSWLDHRDDLLALLAAIDGPPVVLAGHSMGGTASLLAAAERPELVDAVLAAAPAAHGEVEENDTRADALADFQRLLAGLERTPVRLLVATFEGDEFDPDPGARAGLVAALAARRGPPTLALFPSGPARGHSGARDWRFTRDYAACVLTLLRAPEAAAPRGLRRRSCGGG
jgi:pimeloyl-ACP methyl ester carboxylesterase